jgi:membrane-associated protein
MENLIKTLMDLFLNLDETLGEIIRQYGTLTYLLIFGVIFAETGFVVTPFLPGDSLIFAAGTFAAKPDTGLNVWLLFILLSVAAVGGDTVNYWIGHKIGARAYSGEIKFIKKEYIERTHAFFQKHGGKTIFLARFVPIVRTFAPFVAGVGEMSYGYFFSYNVFGGIAWVGIFLFLGYFFGNIPFVQANFELVIIAIILISVVPAVVEVLKERAQAKQKKAGLKEGAGAAE